MFQDTTFFHNLTSTDVRGLWLLLFAHEPNNSDNKLTIDHAIRFSKFNDRICIRYISIKVTDITTLCMI